MFSSLCSARGGDEVDKAEEAIKMLLELQRKAGDDSALMRIVGYPGDLAALGPINRHVGSNSDIYV